MLFPEVCPLCRKCGPAPCEQCAQGLVGVGTTQPPTGVDQFSALFEYDDEGISMLRAIKFHNRRDGLRWASRQMANEVGHLHFDAVTWIPSTTSWRKHGYEVAQLLAKEVGRQLEVPALQLLTRRAGDPGQRTKVRRDRLAGPDLRLRRNAPGPSVLLIDDVVTTGGTLSRAADVLRSGGAGFVYGAALARRPKVSYR